MLNRYVCRLDDIEKSQRKRQVAGGQRQDRRHVQTDQSPHRETGRQERSDGSDGNRSRIVISPCALCRNVIFCFFPARTWKRI